MRVLIVDLLCNTPFYDSALVRALVEAGADAQLASPKFYVEPDYLSSCPIAGWITDLTVHLSEPRKLRLASRAVELSLNFGRLLSHVASGRYDVVHVEWIPLEDRRTIFMRLLDRACAHGGAALVFTAHNVLPHDKADADRVTLRRNLEHADFIVALSEHVAESLRQTIGVKTDVTVIPHGALHTELQLQPRESALSAVGLQEGPVVLFAGIVRPYKGIDILTEAWPHIRGTFPSATLVVAGRALGDEAAAQLQRLSLEPGVRVVNEYVPLKTMIDYHIASDVVVFPYRAISQSGALATALGLGRPVVITPTDGFVEQAAGISSVVISEAIDGPAFAKATIAALERRETLDRLAADERRALAQSSKGWPAVARATLRAYERAIAATQDSMTRARKD